MRATFLIGWLVFSAIHLSSQPPCSQAYLSINEEIMAKGSTFLPKAVMKLDSLGQACKQELSEYAPDTLALIHHKKGVYAFYIGDYDKALQAHQAALSVRMQDSTVDPVTVGHSHLNIAKVYRKQNQFQEAKVHLEVAIDTLKRHQNHRRTGEACFELAILLRELQDYYPAIDYAKQANEYFLIAKESTKTLKNIATAQQLLGDLFQIINEDDSAKHYGYRSYLGYKRLGMNHIAFRYFVNLAKLELKYNRYKIALQTYQEALLEIVVLDKKPLYDLSIIYNGMSVCYFELGDMEEAEAYLEQAYDLRKKLYGNGFHPSFVQIFENKGDYAQHRGELDQALIFYQQGIKQAIPGFRPEDDWAAPVISDTTFILGNYDILLRILQAKGQALVKLAGNSPDSSRCLQEALASYQQADQLLFRMRQEQLESNTQLYWVEKGRTLYEPAIRLSLRMGMLEEAFRLSERSKASLLLAGVRSRQAATLSDEYAAILEQENTLKADMYAAEIRLSNLLASNNTDVVQIGAMRDRVTASRIAFYRFVGGLQDQYPAYFKSKYAPSVASIQALQAFLGSQATSTSVVSLFEGEATDVVFVVSKDSAFAYQIQSQRPSITPFLQLLATPAPFPADYLEQYAEQAYSLFQQTLVPGKLSTKRLIIIPDGIYARLPFETLLTDKSTQPSLDGLPLVLKQFTCTYAYSASILLQSQQREAKRPTKQVLGLAPVQFRAFPSLSPLPGTEQEVANLIDSWGGTPLTFAAATRAQFIREMQQHQILHLATHAAVEMDSDYPYIVFWDTTLSLPEVYTLHTDADLVVLSACQTLDGRMRKGEGVMSLTRAFRYIGVPSAVASIWQAEDQSTQRIVEAFYQYLAEGLPKDQALQQAKLDYLAYMSEQLAEEATYPFFWAHLIHMGDPTPIELRTPWKAWLWRITIGGCVLLSIFWGVRRQRRKA